MMADLHSEPGLELVLVTHERKILEVHCTSVSLPASLGYVTILPEHTPIISTIAAGELSFEQEGTSRVLALAGGFFEVSENVVTVLANTAELPEEIDTEAAAVASREAREAMATASGSELTEARRKLEHAETRLAVAQKAAN